jgi:hypothetical protein
MKTLVTVLATLAAFCTPALAGNAMDKGVAAAAVYTKYCDAKAIPPKLEQMLDVYVSTRAQQVLDEMSHINDFFGTASGDEQADIKMWCIFMKPEIAKFVRGTLTSSR